ncbi:MAG: DUF421 domain-containing protein [Planococcaceae bacterium]|nr:DUF421 domain-containing protein [Planococcaceae bacterium]
MNKIIEFFQFNELLSNTGFATRTVVSIILIYFMSRFLLKRAAGQFTAFDFVFLWMLGALAVAPLLDGKILFATTILATATLYLWHFLISWLSVRSHTFASLIRRQSTLLVEKGIINEKNMRKSFFNNDLLLAEMRLAEAHDLKEVNQVRLEPSGHLSIVKNSKNLPPTPADFKIPVPPGGLPTVLINNGKVIQENLMLLGLTEVWLENQLFKRGIINIKDMYLATISPDGEFYYSVKNFH